jgi:hypothetical protein
MPIVSAHGESEMHPDRKGEAGSAVSGRSKRNQWSVGIKVFPQVNKCSKHKDFFWFMAEYLIESNIPILATP